MQFRVYNVNFVIDKKAEKILLIVIGYEVYYFELKFINRKYIMIHINYTEKERTKFKFIDFFSIHLKLVQGVLKNS